MELKELHSDLSVAAKIDEFNKVLNRPPKIEWLKVHPLAKAKDDEGKLVPALYLPIDKVEHILTTLFQQWRIEVLEEKAIYNSICVRVRVHVKHPVTGEWTFNDGCGAKALQVDANEPASNMQAIKSAALEMAYPSAKSYAIKDACEHFGEIFGRNLNRANSALFEKGIYSDDEVETKPTIKIAGKVSEVFASAKEVINSITDTHNSNNVNTEGI